MRCARPKAEQSHQKSGTGESSDTCVNTQADTPIAGMSVARTHVGSCVPGCSACYTRDPHLFSSPQRGGCSQSTTPRSCIRLPVSLRELAVTQALVTRSTVVGVVAATSDTPTWIVSLRGFVPRQSALSSYLFLLLVPHGIVTHLHSNSTPGSSLRLRTLADS